MPPGPPNLRLSQRDVILPPCADCELELEGIDPEERDGHQCSHRLDDIGMPADDEPGTPVVRAPRRGHPNPGVVPMEVSNLDAKFDVLRELRRQSYHWLIQLTSVCGKDTC